jgi:hypothetical protein
MVRKSASNMLSFEDKMTKKIKRPETSFPVVIVVAVKKKIPFVIPTTEIAQ